MATVTNVAAGKPKIGGAVSFAPTTATLPTDATTALAGFTNLGYISEDGLTQSVERTTENIKAWGGDVVLNIQTEFVETFSFKLIESLNVDARKAVFGDANVSGALSTGITTIINSKEMPEKAWVIDMVARDAVTRIVVPNGKVTAIGEISYTDSDAIGYDITVTAFPDSSGNASYEYTKTASLSA